MVDRQQGTVGAAGGGLAAAVQAKPFHAVVVIAGALLVGGVGAVVLVGRCGAGERVPERVKHLNLVTRCHRDGVRQAFTDRRKTQRAQGRRQSCGAGSGTCAGGCGTAAQTQATQQRATGRPGAAKQQVPTAQTGADDCVNVGVAGGIGVFSVEDVVWAQRLLVHVGDLMSGLYQRMSVSAVCETIVTVLAAQAWGMDISTN